MFFRSILSNVLQISDLAVVYEDAVKHVKKWRQRSATTYVIYNMEVVDQLYDEINKYK